MAFVLKEEPETSGFVVVLQDREEWNVGIELLNDAVGQDKTMDFAD